MCKMAWGGETRMEQPKGISRKEQGPFFERARGKAELGNQPGPCLANWLAKVGNFLVTPFAVFPDSGKRHLKRAASVPPKTVSRQPSRLMFWPPCSGENSLSPPLLGLL